MISTATAIGIAIIMLLLGGAIGALLYRSFHPDGKRNPELQTKLEAAEKKYSDYQQDVSDHFHETARRVNDLTKHYRDVHDYLASSATKLTNPEMSREFIEGAQRHLPHRDIVEDETMEIRDSEAGVETDEEETVATEEFGDRKKPETV